MVKNVHALENSQRDPPVGGDGLALGPRPPRDRVVYDGGGLGDAPLPILLRGADEWSPAADSARHGGFHAAGGTDGLSVHVFAHLAWEPSVLPDATVPAIFDVGAEFESLWERLERVIGWRTTDPLRAEVRAWDVLLALVRNANQVPETPSSNLVNKALTYIDTHLSEGVHASQVADAMGVSRAYLNRRFSEQTGYSITHAILSRRLDRVFHLLRATDLPIKAIASQLGYADVQHLNKHVRGATGKSPRAWR